MCLIPELQSQCLKVFLEKWVVLFVVRVNFCNPNDEWLIRVPYWSLKLIFRCYRRSKQCSIVKDT